MGTNSKGRPTADFMALLMKGEPSETTPGQIGSGPGFDTTLPPPADPLQPTLRYDLRLNQIRPYDRNPRRQRNPRYDEIKDSIRAQGGLNNPITVTRRPGDDWCMIESGGNTRLQVLQELYAETGDERFNRVPVVFRPWQSDTHVLTAHLIENELRGDMVLIDKALALENLRQQIEQAAGGSVSRNEYLKRLAAFGYTISKRTIIVFEYAAAVLYPMIPTALQAGMGSGPVERLRKLEKAFRAYWQLKVPPEHADAFDTAWSKCLRSYDAETLQLDRFQKDFEGVLSETAGISLQLVRIEIDSALIRAGDTSGDEPMDSTPVTDPAELAPAAPLPAPPDPAPAPVSAAAPAPEPVATPATPSLAPTKPAVTSPVTRHSPAAADSDSDSGDGDAGDEEDFDLVELPPHDSAMTASDTDEFGDTDLTALRNKVAQHAFNLSRLFALDCYLEFPEPSTACGYGYLIDLPHTPLSASNPKDCNRCGIWWFMASLCGQHDFPDRLDEIAGKSLRITPRLIEVRDTGDGFPIAEQVEPLVNPLFNGQSIGCLEIEDEAWEEAIALVRAVRAITRWLMVNDQPQAVLWGAAS